MKKIVLLACASRKALSTTKAKELYASQLFKLNLQYAYKLEPDSIYILSAKHGLIDLDTEIEPYNVTLNQMTLALRKQWAQNVLRQLEKRADLQHDLFVFLAGQRYRQYLLSHLVFHEIPFEGLPIGQQLQALKRVLYGSTL